MQFFEAGSRENFGSVLRVQCMSRRCTMVAYQHRSVHRHGILETLRDATMGSSWEQIRLLEILPGANQANKNFEYAIPTLRGANRSL
jgi:hypothetical protein